MSAVQQQITDFVSNHCIVRDDYIMSKVVWSMKMVGNPKSPRYMKWRVFIAITAKDDKIKITKKYIEGAELPNGAIGKLWTVSGQENGKTTTSEPSYPSGKNLNRANATTSFTQALLDARSAFNLKIRRGGTTDKSKLISSNTSNLTFEQLIKLPRGDTPWRIFPMALHDVSKFSNWKHITYPGIIQPKYDGTRFIVVHHPLISRFETLESDVLSNIDGYSRGRESYEGQDHILLELLPVLRNYPGLYLDGELWKEGYGLQHVSGSSRRQIDSKIQTEKIKLDYYVFDCFELSKQRPFSERRSLLGILRYSLSNAKYIKFAPDREYKDKNEAIKHYQDYLELNLEGGVLRNLDSPYEYGINKEIRSHQTLKIKPVDDDEWPVIGFSCGTKGKNIGALQWILTATPQTLKEHSIKYDKTFTPTTEEDLKFESSTKGYDYEFLYKAYKFLTDNPTYFEKHLKNKPMVVQFSIISDYGKPQQPKVLGFKDKRTQIEFASQIQF